jgi:hypothetical protein
MVDRAQEQRRVWVGDLGEVRGLVPFAELAHTRRRPSDGLRRWGGGRGGSGYHQKVESIPSSSSSGVV